MSIKFLVLGGGNFGFLGGGGRSADFIFMGARIFLKVYILLNSTVMQMLCSFGPP